MHEGAIRPVVLWRSAMSSIGGTGEDVCHPFDEDFVVVVVVLHDRLVTSAAAAHRGRARAAYAGAVPLL